MKRVKIMSNKKTIKVLIADDSKLTAVGLKTMLKEQKDLGCLGIASNGQMAIEMTKELQPDIILMDIGMPILDGIQATKQIKSCCPETKIIMLTSHDEPQEIFDAFSAGANSYCMKEIEPADLVNVIKTTFNGATWLDPTIARVVLNGLGKNLSHYDEKNELTEREIEILKLVSQGKTNSQISDTLFISMNTVKTHMKNIFQKLEVNDRTEAAVLGLKKEIL